MVKYTWVKNKVPNNLEIKQVYGIAFLEDMRVLLRLDNMEENQNKTRFLKKL